MEIKAIDFKEVKLAVLNVSSNELYIPLQGKHTTNPEEQAFDLAGKIMQFFAFDTANLSDPRVMLLLGDTGSGKSVFSQQIHQQLWRAYNAGDPIPLWIPLPELQNPFHEAVEEVLKKYGFDDRQVSEIKATERFIFVVDGYDELHQFQNCYVTNGWNQWNAKVLITCRSQALYYQQDPDKYFMPFKGEKRLPMLLRKLFVAPFSKDQISAYVVQYQRINSEHNITEEDFAKVPGLTDLITTPFLLHLSVEALPDILAAQVDDQKMTQAKLYDVFIERWFTRQVAKLDFTGHLTESEENTKQRFWDYCKRLAQKMHEEQVSVIPYRGQKIGGRLFGQQDQTDIWKSFFNEDTEVLRSACPLKRMGDHHYGFIHASFVEYFSTRAMYEEIQADESEIVEKLHSIDHQDEHAHLDFSNQPHGGIHQRLFSLERQSIQFISDRIEMSEQFKRKVLAILNTSKKSSRYAIGAANAITALVRAGIKFNWADLSGINITGADISGGFFWGAKLINANLNNTRMYHVWLSEADLEGSQMEGVNFGEFPWFKQNNSVKSFDYREDLRIMVTSCDKEIWVWDITTREQLFKIPDRSEVLKVAFSTNGEKVIASYQDMKVRVWEIETGKELGIWQADKSVNSIDFSPDGQLVVSARSNHKNRHADNTVRVCEIISGKEVCILQGRPPQEFSVHDKEIQQYYDLQKRIDKVNFSPDGQFVVAIDGIHNKSVWIWQLNNGDALSKPVDINERICAYAFNTSQDKIVFGGSYSDKVARIFDLTNGRLTAEFHGHEEYITSAAFNINGDYLVTGSSDLTIRVWEVASRKSTYVLLGHAGPVKQVQFINNDKQIISASTDGTIRIWDISVPALVARTRGHQERVRSIYFNLNGDRFITVGWHQSIRTWDVLSGSQIENQDLIKNEVLAISEDAERFIVYHNDSDNDDYQWVYESDESDAAPELVANENGVDIYRTMSVKNVKTWNTEYVMNGHLENSLVTPKRKTINCAQFSFDGSLVVSGGDDCMVRIWKVAEGENNIALKTATGFMKGFHGMRDLIQHNNAVLTLKGHAKKVTEVAFSSDAKFVISASKDKTVRVWELASGKNITVFRKHNESISTVQFSPDTVHVFSDSEDQVLYIWNMFTGKIIKTFKGMHYVQISDDGKRVLSSQNKEFRITDIESAHCLSVLKLYRDVGKFDYHPNGSLVVGYLDGCIELWKNLGNNQHYEWELKWSTDIDSRSLHLEDVCASHVVGLNDQNCTMLVQRGAVVANKITPNMLPSFSGFSVEVARRTGSPVYQNDNNVNNYKSEQSERRKNCIIA